MWEGRWYDVWRCRVFQMQETSYLEARKRENTALSWIWKLSGIVRKIIVPRARTNSASFHKVWSADGTFSQVTSDLA